MTPDELRKLADDVNKQFIHWDLPTALRQAAAEIERLREALSKVAHTTIGQVDAVGAVPLLMMLGGMARSALAGETK